MSSEWIGIDRVGCVIDGRFTLQRWLGGTAQSGVYLTQFSDGRPQNAAIKLIAADAADAESLYAQWVRAKRFSHPHLMPLFDAGRCRVDGRDLLYTITEHADEILAEVLPSRTLTPAEVREMLDPVLDALSWLHAQGLVHGGLKPSNIMVVNEQLKLAVDRVQPAGRRICFSSSPDVHEAPESAKKITSAVDIWSLGVLLVEALTQRPPQEDAAHPTEPVVPASLPQPFAGIARECLRIQPAHRCTLSEIKSHLAPASLAAMRGSGTYSSAPPVTPAAVQSSAVTASSSLVFTQAAIAELQPPLSQAPAGVIAPAAEAEGPAIDSAPPPAESGPNPSTAIEEVHAVPPVPLAGVPAASPEPPAVTPPVVEAQPPDAETLQSSSMNEASSLSAAEEGSAAAPAPSSVSIAQSPTSVQRPERIPAASRPSGAPRAPANRHATLVALAMVLVVAVLTLAVALHHSPRFSSPAVQVSAPAASPASALPRSAAPAPGSPSASASTGSTLPGAVLQRVVPEVGPTAKASIRGRLVVVVRVKVDPSGNVSSAAFDYEGISQYFANLSLDAARNWKFRPAQIGGRPVPSTWVLQFSFEQSGSDVNPIEEAPQNPRPSKGL